jgi:predicted histidine transporter YuiF (NhaC family)
MTTIATTTAPLLIAAFENVRLYALVLGIGGLVGGVLLFINHKRQYDAVLASDADERTRAFETRKYRRRAIVSAMIASVGCMLAALYWVRDAKIYSAFILMILALLLGIMGMAIIDLFSVGLRQLGTPDKDAEKRMIEEYLRQREKAAKAKQDET